jgi:hypothetical protein
MKDEYHKKYNTKQNQDKVKRREMEEMEAENIRSQMERTKEKKKKVLSKYDLITKANQLKRLPQGRAELRDKGYQKLIDAQREKIKQEEKEEAEREKRKQEYEEKRRQADIVIHIINRQGMNWLFEKNYDAGDDMLLPPFPKAPNKQYYNEDDWSDFKNMDTMTKKTYKDRFEPLLKKLKKLGYLDYDINRK